MRSIPKMSIFIKKSYLHMPKMGLLYIIKVSNLGMFEGVNDGGIWNTGTVR